MSNNEIEISDETKAAYARAHFAPTPEEFRAAAKETVDSAAKDCIKHILKPVAGLALYILYAETLARRFSQIAPWLPRYANRGE